MCKELDARWINEEGRNGRYELVSEEDERGVNHRANVLYNNEGKELKGALRLLSLLRWSTELRGIENVEKCEKLYWCGELPKELCELDVLIRLSESRDRRKELGEVSNRLAHLYASRISATRKSGCICFVGGEELTHQMDEPYYYLDQGEVVSALTSSPLLGEKLKQVRRSEGGGGWIAEYVYQEQGFKVEESETIEEMLRDSEVMVMLWGKRRRESCKEVWEELKRSGDWMTWGVKSSHSDIERRVYGLKRSWCENEARRREEV